MWRGSPAERIRSRSERDSLFFVPAVFVPAFFVWRARNSEVPHRRASGMIPRETGGIVHQCREGDEQKGEKGTVCCSG